MDCLKNCVIIIAAKLCNQRQFFSHDVELNNYGILHYIYITSHPLTCESPPILAVVQYSLIPNHFNQLDMHLGELCETA